MPPLMESPSGPEIVIDGRPYLYFGGTSYSGLQAHPEVIEAGVRALQTWGLHTGTSRAGFGTSKPLLDVEHHAAEFFGTEDAFYFGSGYVSNHIVVSAIGDGFDAIAIDEAAHFCLHEAARLAGKPVVAFRHHDPRDLERAIRSHESVLVMADAVGPSSGTLAPVFDYLPILGTHGKASLLLDDAHGFGVLGKDGRGLFDDLGLWPHVNGGASFRGVRLYVTGTLAKALGGFGGILPGRHAFVESARRATHFFDGASPPPPCVAAAASQALEILMAQPNIRLKLQENILRLRQGLRKLGLNVPDGATANLGLTIENAERMRSIHLTLKERGILLPYVPTYSGIPAQGVLRFAVFANHRFDQIDRLLAELRSLLT